MFGLRWERNQAGSYRRHTEALQTQTYLRWPGRSQWLISPQAASDKDQKNVNKFSVCANLLYYLRTAAERWAVLTSVCFLTAESKQQKKKKQRGEGEWLIWCQIKKRANIFICFYFQPWNNFKILFPSRFSWICLPPHDIEKTRRVKSR